MNSGERIEQDAMDRAILMLRGDHQRYGLWQLSRVNWEAIAILALCEAYFGYLPTSRFLP